LWTALGTASFVDPSPPALVHGAEHGGALVSDEAERRENRNDEPAHPPSI
jgi:hypothetical protein